MQRQLIVTVALLVMGCSGGVTGELRDAATEKPVAGAKVSLVNAGWGRSDGRLVWDAEKRSVAQTDGQEHFSFRESGGGSLVVEAADYAPMRISLCAAMPMIVRIGGPFASVEANRRLLITDEKQPRKGDFHLDRTTSQLGIRVSGDALYDGDALRVDAPSLAFVRGTGAIPAVPRLGLTTSIDLDLRSDCGWLFFRAQDGTLNVIAIGSMFGEQGPGHPPRPIMLYAPLPDVVADGRARS